MAANHPLLNKFSLALVPALLFVLPLAHTTGLRNLLAGSLALAAFGFWMARCRDKCFFPLPLMLWVALCVASTFWSISPGYSFREAFWNAMVPTGCFLAIQLWAPSSQRITAWFVVPLLFGLTSILAIRLLSLWIGTDTATVIEVLYAYWPGRGVGSTIAVLTLPLAAWLLATGKRRVGVTLMIVALLVGSQNWNRMFWVAALVTLVPCLWMGSVKPQVKAGLLVGLAAIVAAGFWFASNKRSLENPQIAAPIEQAISGDTRWGIWPEWVKMGMDRPLLGHGFGFRTIQQAAAGKLPPWLQVYESNSAAHAHNVFIDVFAQLGLVGLVLFILMLGDFARRFWRMARKGGDQRAAAIGGIALIVGMLAKNMTDDFMNHAVVILFWLIMGVFAKSADIFSSEKKHETA